MLENLCGAEIDVMNIIRSLEPNAQLMANWMFPDLDPRLLTIKPTSSSMNWGDDFEIPKCQSLGVKAMLSV